MKELYIKLLQYLCRRELKKISDQYPHSRKDLIRYHDFMAMECVNTETKAQERVLGISLSTAKLLEAKEWLNSSGVLDFSKTNKKEVS
jgi:hypothetical protein